MLGSGKKGAKA